MYVLASPVCRLEVIDTENRRNMDFALVQIINLLAEPGLAQLNTHKLQTRAMLAGADEWDER